ncbi:MAG: IclR family transcriptional regulator [Deltaproteobacteria bacterium]|nr:IclR family transcriptional regulator [Deltaproteobacteria bacterium]
MSSGDKPYFFVKSVDKVFRVIETLAKKRYVSLGELASEVQMTKSNVHRLLLTLNHLGYVGLSHDGKQYTLSYKLFSLGSSIPSRQALVNEAYPSMEKLSKISRETINLGILFEDMVLYLEKIPSPEALRIDQQVGKFDPCYCTALGKALLANLDTGALDEYLERQKPLKAYTKNTITDPQRLIEVLEEVRTQGYAIDREEVIEGVCCIGAPLLKDGEAVAAISISGPRMRMTDQRIQELIPYLLEYVGEVSDRL